MRAASSCHLGPRIARGPDRWGSGVGASALMRGHVSCCLAALRASSRCRSVVSIALGPRASLGHLALRVVVFGRRAFVGIQRGGTQGGVALMHGALFGSTPLPSVSSRCFGPRALSWCRSGGLPSRIGAAFSGSCSPAVLLRPSRLCADCPRPLDCCMHPKLKETPTHK